MGKRGPVARKGAPTTIRFEPALRSQLEQAAERGGRSLSEEVTLRLRLSLEGRDIERDFGDAETYGLARLIGWAFEDIKRQSGHTWFEHPWSYKHAARSLDRLFSYFRPPGSSAVPDDAPLLEHMRQQGMSDLIIESARLKLASYEYGIIGGSAAVALLEAAAANPDGPPELARLKPVAAVLAARLRQANADGVALDDLNAVAGKPESGVTL